MTSAEARDTSKARHFVFDGVVVDESAARLIVDGRDRICSQRAFRLIVAMCESGGQVLTKQQVIDRLWPGGQIVSDEALTQIVFRARNCLDRHAARLVTVRGVGLRLDAVVREVEGGAEPLLPEPLPPIAASATSVLEPETAVETQAQHAQASSEPEAASVAMEESPIPIPPRTHPIAAPRSFAPWWIAVALLALLLVAWLAWRAASTVDESGGGAYVDVGYGLTVADAHVARQDSIALLREAFGHEGRGDRARARALLETVQENDAATPVPALFLAVWAIGGGSTRESDRWLEQARERLKPIASPPLTALLRYIEAERSANPQEVLRYAGAVLDQRPGAWQMRLARAHLLEDADLREAALKELQQVEVTTLNHRKLAMALADRASFGDPEGAEAIFAKVRGTAAEQSTLHFLRGRFAWTRADWPAAAQAFGEAQDAARRELRFDLEHRAAVNRGAIALLQGEVARAIDLLDGARRGMIENHWVYDEIDLGLMLAQLHALNGDARQVRAELDNAEAALARSHAPALRDLLAVYRARFTSEAASGADIPADAGPALAPLLAAWAALRDGDEAAALSHFDTARRRAVPVSALHDETRLLAVKLGQTPDAPYRVDPPYPPLARLATRLAAGEAATQSRP